MASKSVELLVSCRDLADLDIFTKTDPMCVLFVKQFGQWKEYGRTEAVRETLNPQFTQSFVMHYEPSIQQQLLFSVYDIDSRSSDLRHHDFVGSVETRMDQLTEEGKKIHTTTRTLRVAGDPKPRGTLQITLEEVTPTRGKVQIHAAGFKLDKIGVLKKKPDCFLEIGRQIDSISYHPVFRTEVVPKARNPWWRPFDISIQRICNDDWDRPIQFSCVHTNFGGGFKTYEVVGQCTMTLRQFSTSQNDNHYRSIELVANKRDRQQKKQTTTGNLRFYQFVIDIQYSLLDYIRGGCGLRLITAIDFTSSNGLMSDPFSLHSLEEARNNQYLNALEALGSIIARYDPEQKVAAFGFGAKTSSDSPTDHCLSLNSHTWFSGIKAVCEAYCNILPSLIFSGPTFIAPILEKAMELAEVKVTQEDQSYFVLLVITDGVVNDMDIVVSKLIDASSLPLSVIILGVGPSDFTLMEQFNQCNTAPLFDHQAKRSADRVNFHFAALKPDAMSSGSHSFVVQEALAALSSQVLQFMKMKKVIPCAPRISKMDPKNSWVSSKTVLEGEETDDILAMLESSLNPSELLSSSSINATGNMANVAKGGNHQFGADPLNGLHCPTCGSLIQPGTQLFGAPMKIV